MHADETYYRVLESETAKTYYWVFLSGRHDKHGITLYHHNPHRSGQVALDFLGAYAGFLHCDMWQAYQRLLEATLVGCWVHVRRKFFEAVPQNASDKSIAKQGLEILHANVPSRKRMGTFKQRRTISNPTGTVKAANGRLL